MLDIKISRPSSVFFHRVDGLRASATAIAVFSGLFGVYYTWPAWLFGLSALSFFFAVFLYGWEAVWLLRGTKLTRELGLGEYLVIPTGLDAGDGITLEIHLQVRYGRVVRYLIRKILRRPHPDVKKRLRELVAGYRHDMEIIAREAREGRWRGKRLLLVATSHPALIKEWKRALERAGGTLVPLGTCIDPAARLGRMGWWIAQVTTLEQAPSKTPPGDWYSYVGIFDFRDNGPF